MRVIALFFIALLSTLHAQSKGYFNISLLDAEIGTELDVGQAVPIYDKDTYFISLDYLNTHYSNNSQMLSTGSFIQSALVHIPNVIVALGAKVVLSSLHGKQFIAMPMGGHANIYIPNTNEMVLIASRLYYAPAALSFRDASSYFEGRIGVAVEPALNMRILFEYRNIFTNFTQDSTPTQFNNTLYVGARIGF